MSKTRDSLCGNLYEESGHVYSSKMVFKGAPHLISEFNRAIYDCVHIDDSLTTEQEKAYIKERMSKALEILNFVEVEGDPRYIGCLYNLIQWHVEDKYD